MGLRKRPARRRTRRFLWTARSGAGVLAATRDWAREQPVSESDHRGAYGAHAELRAAAGLDVDAGRSG